MKDNTKTIGEYSAKQVADYFVYLASEKNVDEGISEGVTPLKLQKLLYFSQAVALSLYKKQLFKDQIEAWKYGPVINSLYQAYKENLNLPLLNPIGDCNEIDDVETQTLLKGVWELFGKYSAGELVEMTHRHDPWKQVYEVGKNNIITPQSIQDYYSGIFKFQS